MNVCPPASPAASQNAAGIGRVATISEYTGTTERGASCADHASVARTTVPAVTTPRSVTTRRGPTAVAVVASTMRPPRRSTARARPRTSRAGWMRAQSGVYDAPSTRVAPTSAAACCAGTKPGSARARRSCTGVRARAIVPPFTQSQAMPSAATALPTSSTVSRMAAPIASAAARPCRRVSAASLAGNSAEHQPPLRPLAPKPATCRSTTSTRRPGSPRSRW